MSRWQAVSRDDYEEEQWPAWRTVPRTCTKCGDVFKMLVDRDYELRPYCPRCQTEANMKHQQQAERTRR